MTLLPDLAGPREGAAPDRLSTTAAAAPSEVPFVFDCGGDALVGIIHRPAGRADLGVLVVVGGPQYRAGSHRQFVLIARALAAAGCAVMRFDYRGMGDSEGARREFEEVEADIARAVEVFRERCPDLERVVLWGLCDGAAAVALNAYKSPTVCGVVLLNPWVRTGAGEAKARIKHYYAKRLLQPEFWRRAISGRLDVADSVKSLLTFLWRASALGSWAADGSSAEATLPRRMAASLARFKGRILLVLSGDDLTAREFIEISTHCRIWRQVLSSSRVTRRDLKNANHTFSRREWRDAVIEWTIDWAKSLK
jgi:uncharacterized protein